MTTKAEPTLLTFVIAYLLEILFGLPLCWLIYFKIFGWDGSMTGLREIWMDKFFWITVGSVSAFIIGGTIRRELLRK
mgnify:CR=1 FL=1